MKLTKEQVSGLEWAMSFGPGFVAECRGIGEIEHRNGVKEGKPWEMVGCKVQLETGDGANVKVQEVEVQAHKGETVEDLRKALSGVVRGALVYVGVRFARDQKGNLVVRVGDVLPLVGPVA